MLQKEPELNDLSIRFTSQDMPAPVDIRIAGGKDDEQRELARTIRRRLAAIQGAADVDIAQRTEVEIDHDSLQRVLDVRANIEDRNRRDMIADIRKMLQELQVPAGIEVKLVE